MSPGLSSDPAARDRQLANLKRGGAPAAPTGNQRRRTHGGYAAVVAGDRVDAKVREVFDALSDDLPLRTATGEAPPADAAMVRLAAEVLCRLDSIAAWLTQRGVLDADGNPRSSVLELESRFRNEAADRLEALGLSPRSRAKLGLDVAKAQGLDLAQALSDVGDKPADETVVDAEAEELR